MKHVDDMPCADKERRKKMWFDQMMQQQQQQHNQFYQYIVCKTFHEL